MSLPRRRSLCHRSRDIGSIAKIQAAGVGKLSSSLPNLKCHFGVSSYLIRRQPEHDLFWMMPRQLCKQVAKTDYNPQVAATGETPVFPVAPPRRRLSMRRRECQAVVGAAHAAGRWIVRPSSSVMSSGSWQRLGVSCGMFLYSDANFFSSSQVPP